MNSKLYDVMNPVDYAKGMMQDATGTFAGQMKREKTTTEGPGKSVGGGIMAGLGGAGAATSILGAGAMATPAGWGITSLAAAAYFLG